MGGPRWGITGLLPLLVLLGTGLGGCFGDPEDGPTPDQPCSGDRTRFFAKAPGLHGTLKGLGSDHPMLTVTSRPATIHGFPPLEADGLRLPATWSGALFASVSWTVAPPRQMADDDYRLPDATNGSFTLSALSGQPRLGGELPTGWSTDQRDAALDAVLANLTALDQSARRSVVGSSRWLDHPGYPGPSTDLDGPGSVSVGPVDSSGPSFVALEPIAIDRVTLAPGLGDASAWELIPGEGLRQGLVGQYSFTVFLPVTVAIWDLRGATVEAVVDAEDWARIYVLSGGHAEPFAHDLLNATLEAAGWEGQAEWEVWHEDDHAPLEPGQGGCPSRS